MRDLSDPPRGGIWNILLPGIMAILFAIVQIRYSIAHGRLAMTPYYDDITYLRDGTQRLDALYQNGLTGLVRAYVAHPPHSPFSSFTAMLGYLIFGIKDWAPYVMNASLVFTLLLCGSRWMRGQGLLIVAATCLFLLSIPFSADMIAEFRPDFACGLSAAIAVILPLRRSMLKSPLGYRLSAGLWFAIALMCKTSAFPLTMMTVGLAWAAGAICDRLSLGREATFKKIIVLWMQVLAPVVILALPLYLIDLRGIVSYIWINIFSARREHWARTGTWWFHASYYLLGEAGVFVLNRHLLLVLLPIVIGVVWMCVRYRVDAACKDRLRRTIALGLVTFAALAVPTLNVVKSTFFGAESQTLLVLGSVLSLRMMLRHDAGKQIGRGLLAIMCLLGIGLFQFPTSLGGPWDLHNRATDRVVNSIESMVVEHTPVHGNVLLTCWGISLNGDSLTYLAARQGKQLSANPLPDDADLSTFSNALSGTDCVVAAEPLVWEFFGNLPTYNLLGQTLELIRRDEDFGLAGTVASEGGPRYFVFYRLPVFTDWDSTVNLGNVEGPYPQWSLPLVRWGNNDQTTLQFHSATGGQFRLSLTAASPMDGQNLTYLIDGKPVADRRDDFPLGIVKSYTLSFAVPAGQHEIALKYGKGVTSDPAGHVLLYRMLRLAQVSTVKE